MYMYAWKKGLKTTYDLRSRPATQIAKTTVPVAAAATRRMLARKTRNPATRASSKGLNIRIKKGAANDSRSRI